MNIVYLSFMENCNDKLKAHDIFMLTNVRNYLFNR